jgi:hypothetical protein
MWERRGAALQAIADTFGDPRPLAASYIEPRVQHHNPADEDEDERAISLRPRPGLRGRQRLPRRRQPAARKA